MKKISPHVKEIILARKQVCARHKEGGCRGRNTFEHVLTYKGSQLDEAFAIIILCEWHHAVNTYQDSGDLNKEINTYHALNQATDEELKSISKAISYLELRERLNKKYGTK